MKAIVKEICERKRKEMIHPVLATEREIKQVLSQRGFPYTIDSYQAMLLELESAEEIITHRLLMYKGYSIRKDADITQDKA